MHFGNDFSIVAPISKVIDCLITAAVCALLCFFELNNVF